MDPKYQNEIELHEDTMRNLETLAHQPGELRFRIALVQSIKDLRREVNMLAIVMAKRMDKLESRKLMDHVQVARIANAEIKSNAQIAKDHLDVKRLWAGAMWLVALLASAGVGGALHAWWTLK
jgi:hypothetical protein